MSCNNNEIAVSVKGLSKAYKIFNTPGKRLSYHLFHTNTGRDFWALRDVEFEVKKGETFGIVGKNGSGKSTMLQILAGIIKPTEGKVLVNGKIAALLELGSGFNPESTGYENIYMNAAILGVKKKEIGKKINQIIEFADIGDFIEQPVKTYSSGMYIRLAFAVAINVDADIILIDEALAVGDVFFRQKCYAKLNELKAEGKTIILVSHGMNEVEQFCDRALLLKKGHVEMLAPSREVVKLYYILDQKKDTESGNKIILTENRDGEESSQSANPIKFGEWSIRDNIFYDLSVSHEVANEKSTFLKIGLFDENGQAKRVFKQGEKAVFYYEVLIKQDIELPLVGTVLYDQRNTIVHGKDNLQIYSRIPKQVKNGSIVVIRQVIELNIGIGEYTFDVGFATMSKEDYDQRSYRNQELVNATMERLASRPKAGNFAVHSKAVGEPMQLMFHGCCDLPGDIEVLVKEG